MIHVEHLTKHYGERVLFEDVSWHVKKRDRIGLSGPNGAGKTTLLRMLAGTEEPDEGSIRMASDTTIGYLPQDGIVHHGRTVYDEVILAFQELLALKEEQHRIEDQLAHREKVLLAAQGFIQRKRYDKAVAEYQKIIQQDPDDARTLLKIGDLQSKMEAHADAIGKATRRDGEDHEVSSGAVTG
jgi:ATPase subunit of ABC transporter with duplicated ATPase domains